MTDDNRGAAGRLLVPRCDGAFMFPRRSCVDKMTPAELAIRAAVQAVEAAGADVRLTEAVILLSRAQERVADYVDGIGVKPEPSNP